MLAGYTRGTSPNRALRLWMFARLIQGLAHLIVWMRPDLPPTLIGIGISHLAPTGLIVGYALEMAAYFELFGVPRWRRLLYPMTLVALGIGGVGYLMHVSTPVAVALTSLILSLFSFFMAATMLCQRGKRSLLRSIMGCNVTIFALVMLVRGYVILDSSRLGLFSPAPVQTVTYLTAYIVLIVNGFGFLLLCKQADDIKLEAMATTDSLTGLANRRAFFSRTETARNVSERGLKKIGLLMLDIDHFKRLNDQFGHAAGDEALRLFAATTHKLLRDNDIMASLGGEEFAVVLPDTDRAGALHVAERIRAAIAAVEVPLAVTTLRFTVSIGVVLLENLEDINQALARADRALYFAKSSGRDRVECEEDMDSGTAAAV